jgi:hypothetical protein
MMKIGVVCEGPTDYPAIAHFFTHALQDRGIAAEFCSLYPELDQTRPAGGWSNVLLWLQNNPPSSRIQRYFGGGLFAGALAADRLDAIIIHLDVDVLPEMSFINFVKENYDYDALDSQDPADRARQIINIISLSARFEEMTVADRIRHVPAPAVESTETWCVAAFTTPPQNFEILKGADLTNSFMTALERSEGRAPQASYENVDKNPQRRKRFCETHANGSLRIINGCQHFSSALEKILPLCAQ